MTSLLGWAAILCVLWYGGTLVTRGSLSAGVLTSFMIYALTVAVAFGIIFSVYGDFMQALGASLRLFDLLDRVPEINTTGGDVIKDMRADLALVDVSFTYPSRPDTPVLRNVYVPVRQRCVQPSAFIWGPCAVFC
eukprot:m.110909 g.110909  ORF g.110909 m.110909 type:complete len:135 (+) comp16989_c0_seq16:2050-2454(+)